MRRAARCGRWFAVLGMAACTAPSGSSTATPTPSDYCDRNVSYWAAKLVSSEGERGLDYQEMGLSDAEYNIVRDVVLAHRADAAASKQLTQADVGRITALCQARRATPVTSTPGDSGRTWPRG